MKIVGIIIAKENSNRFPNKNIYNYKGKPLFWHNVECLLNSNYDMDIYVSTDSDYIKQYCSKNNIKTINRGKNINKDDQTLFEVLKYSYQTLENEYDIICNILSNSIENKSEDVDSAINLLINNRLKEVRSYDDNGIENGILVLEKESMNKNELSSYVGAIKTKSKEIHYESEIKK
jgi:CMP-N-acetylneuraminic acid synthetase